MTTFYDQLTDAGTGIYEAVACIIGIDEPGAAFNCALRDIAPIKGRWTIGQAAEHYLVNHLANLRTLSNKKAT